MAALRAERPPWTWNDIATVLNRPSGQGVRSRYEKTKQAAEARKVRRTIIKRPCMTCKRPIRSTGPGHRRCDNCRANIHETPFDCTGAPSIRDMIETAERGTTI